MALLIRSLFSLLLLLVFNSSLKAQQLSVNDGTWKGSIDIMGQPLLITLTFSTQDSQRKGTIDIPQQSAFNLPLEQLSISNPQNIRFNLPSNIGLATFNGKLNENGDRIEGTFRQNGQSFQFYVELQSESNKEKKNISSEDVQIQNGGIILEGTLTYPKKMIGGSYPLIIMITGSGAQTRDVQIGEFSVFKTLAENLSDEGYAVFRYDDRGTGNSNGNLAQATLSDHVSDILAIHNKLEDHKRVDANQIGVLGHSQGGLIASKALSEIEALQFGILMASPAYPLSDLILQQVERLSNSNDAETESSIQQQKKLFNALRNNSFPDSLVQELAETDRKQLEMLSESQKEQLGDLDHYAMFMAKQKIAGIQTPSFKSFLDYNPRTDLRETDKPILVLLGSKDMQVYSDTNTKTYKELLEERDNRKDELCVIDGANHLFQKAQTGLPQEYGTLEPEFMKPFQSALLKWLDGVVK